MRICALCGVCAGVRDEPACMATSSLNTHRRPACMATRSPHRTNPGLHTARCQRANRAWCSEGDQCQAFPLHTFGGRFRQGILLKLLGGAPDRLLIVVSLRTQTQTPESPSRHRAFTGSVILIHTHQAERRCKNHARSSEQLHLRQACAWVCLLLSTGADAVRAHTDSIANAFCDALPL